jgi:hypothetical protein
MPFFAAPLADGQLPNAQAAIYTVPGGVTAYVKQVLFFNTNAATQTIDVWIDTSGTPRQWRRFELAQNQSASLLSEGESLQLVAGCSIQAVTTTASAVDYTITGVIET